MFRAIITALSPVNLHHCSLNLAQVDTKDRFDATYGDILATRLSLYGVRAKFNRVRRLFSSIRISQFEVRSLE